ncbi:MAG: BON domain-containing protein [Gemmataceae bacterium]|nr:BON domain-containing protein [Gemmataceae bacterium]MDW8264535.1 BON domain-containing protein [Gemmataceae bacterium]
MTLRNISALSAGLALWMAQATPAQEPQRPSANPTRSLPAAAAVNDNQQLAQAIREKLRQSGRLRGYGINIVCQSGTVDLTGYVADQVQREEAVRIVQSVPGVERVRDRLTVTQGVVLVQNPPVPAPIPLPQAPAPSAGAITDPMPLYQLAPAGAAHLPPNMPPYAWPTYAPYNNFSRVAYPLAYPYHAWPFIGPCYPFPKVPLGWRRVKLEWEDGHWWYSKLATKHDWWRLRYW